MRWNVETSGKDMWETNEDQVRDILGVAGPMGAMQRRSMQGAAQAMAATSIEGQRDVRAESREGTATSPGGPAVRPLARRPVRVSVAVPKSRASIQLSAPSNTRQASGKQRQGQGGEDAHVRGRALAHPAVAVMAALAVRLRSRRGTQGTDAQH